MNAAAARVSMSAYLAVALGAAAGGLLRTGLALAWAPDGAVGWPWPTLLVNLLGSALIGVFWARVGPESAVQVSVERRLLVMTGFCGGFTTFSAFGVETVKFSSTGMPGSALVHALLTGVAAPLMAWVGWCLVRAQYRPDSER